jgi:hypothetical protein
MKATNIIPFLVVVHADKLENVNIIQRVKYTEPTSIAS